MFKFYENRQGEETCIDTHAIDYGAVWKSIRLRPDRWPAADRIVDLYHKDECRMPHHHYKATMRDENRLAGEHYRTRAEIEEAAIDDSLVKKLVDYDILELHGTWRRILLTRYKTQKGTSIGPGHRRHPQAVYRMNWWRLNEIESKSE